MSKLVTAPAATYSDAAIVERRVLALTRRVDYEVRDFEIYPAVIPGAIRIRARSGCVLGAEIPHRRDGAQPMTAEAAEVETVQDAILGLEARTDFPAAIASITRLASFHEAS